MSEHPCPINGCTMLVGAAHPLCAGHQRTLPPDLLRAVARSHNPHEPPDQQGLGFHRALANAAAWIAATYGGRTDRTKPSWGALKSATRRRDAERNARRGLPPPPCVEPAQAKPDANTEPEPPQASSAPQLKLL